jgi:hypothetical protein
MQATELEWSQTEKDVARHAFDQAYDREIDDLVTIVRTQATKISALTDLWSLHDFLSARRHEIDGKYDFKYPGLLFVFARLVHDGWMKTEDLVGLEKDKIAKISALARMQ